MGRPTKDYKKLYQEIDKDLDQLQENVNWATKKIDHLDEELDKAVAINKQYQQTIFEQRVVIRYLELQGIKLNDKLTKMGKTNERA